MALFFSHGVSLANWDQLGLFDREVGYYRHLAQELGGILFYTYDQPSIGLGELLARLSPIKAIYNHWQMPYKIFGILGPFLHFQELKHCQLFKTNQLSGAWTGAIAKCLLQKPLVVRCGYIKSRNMARGGVIKKSLFLTIISEKISLRFANLIFVATESDRQHLAQTHNIPLERITIVPNPIDTNLFRPIPEIPKRTGLVIFVGRFSHEKNPELLINACNQLPQTRLLMVGSGPLEYELKKLISGDNIEFKGNVPNRDLSALLNQAQVFVLPSSWEGSPKALLEAMACGLAVIGTNVPGVREVIQHGVNGLLCEPKVADMAAAIRQVLADGNLRYRLGLQARSYVVENNSLDLVVEKEGALLRSLISGQERQQEAPAQVSSSLG
jgi:glycosyltransferase involved in cell wall biosynthesis